MDSLPLQQRSKLFSWSSSVDSTTGDEVSFLEDWNVLKDMIMLLDDKNYARNSKVISSTLMDVMKCQSDNTPTLCILHLLYEKALRDTLTKAFPVSANLLESLTSNCIQKVFDNVKGSIENNLNCLQKKLQQVLILSGTDIGVIYLLLSMCKLGSLESNVSPTTYIITQLIKDTKDYLDKVQYEDKFVSDELVIYLYGLICFSLQYELMNSDINFIIIYLRKVYLLKAHMFTVLGRVMAIDIIEQLHKKDVHIQLYSAVYKKILSSKHTFLLREVKLFLSLHECPIPAISINDQSDCADEGFQTILPSSSNSSNLLQRCSRESSPILPQKESILTNSDKNVNDFTEKKTSTDLIDPSLNKYSNKKSWNKCILDFQVNKPDDLLTEILEIEERFFSSVQGYEGMVVRELERKSGAVIKIRAKDFTRPNTSSLTAHKLITGALGVPAQKPIIEEELQKLKDARIKRQNQDQEIITRQLKIIGCQDNIDKAKKLIKNICDNSVTLSVALDLTVDEILEYSVKLKGIEVLLNVYMVVNEQIDNSVIITICGEMKCCQDARKLILEEVGSFRIQDGCLFTVPSELMSVCGSREGLEELVDVISRFSGGNIIVLTSLPKYMVFVGGSSNEISKAINIFQKVNIELLCSLNSNYDAIDKLEFDVEDLVEYISKRFGHEFVSQSRLPTLMSKYFKEEKKTTKRFVYSCDELMGYANCKYAEEFPEFLCNMEDNLAYSIIKPQFVDNAIKRVNYGNVARNKENNMLHKDEQTDRPKSMSAAIRSTKDRFVHPRDEFMAYAHCKYPEEFSELLRNMEDNIGCNIIKQDESTQSQF